MPLESPNEPPMSTPTYGPGIEITGRITAEYAEILTPEAVAFAAKLQRAFGDRRAKLLARRAQRQAELDAGKLPDFLPETRAIRDGDWTCAPYPADIARPARRDHGSRRPQDDRQRAQLGRQRVHGRLRGRQHAEVGQQPAGASQSARRDPPADRLHVARGQAVSAATKRPPCCSCGRAAGICPRSTS